MSSSPSTVDAWCVLCCDDCVDGLVARASEGDEEAAAVVNALEGWSEATTTGPKKYTCCDCGGLIGDEPGAYVVARCTDAAGETLSLVLTPCPECAERCSDDPEELIQLGVKGLRTEYTVTLMAPAGHA